MECQFCNATKKSTNSLKCHERCCKQNPNRTPTYYENWTEEKRARHSKLMKERNTNSLREFSLEKRQQLSIKQKLHNENYWNDETRKIHSKKMKEIVLNNPNSYINKDCRGSRVKSIKSYDSFGSEVILKGTWEVLIAQLLTEQNVKWKKDQLLGEYEWNNGLHLYYVDFYLPEYEVYIEVKGYETERDRAKYSLCPSLIILKQKQISDLSKGLTSIKQYIALS